MRTTNRGKALALATLVLALAVIVAFLAHGAEVTGPLFAQSREVPSVVDPAPPPRFAASVERARELARAAILDQNLPGVSVALGIGMASATSANEGLPPGVLAKADGLVWAE